MKVNRFVLLAFVSAVVLLGCDPPPQEKSEGTTGTSTTTTKAAPTPSIAEIPESLKNDAFHYYGLGKKEPTNLVITVPGAPEPLTGTQSAEFVGMEGGKARFKIVRTGKLAQLGDEVVLLGSEGIVADSVSPGTLEGHPMELPAEMKPGTTWKTDYKVMQPETTVPGENGAPGMTTPAQTQEDHSTFKVVGPQKVNTKAGTFDAILVESTGNDVLNGKKTKLETKTWYVKDRGAVKTVFVTTPQGGTSNTMTLEESK